MGDDGQGHEAKDPQEEPVHVQPPRSVPVDGCQRLLSERPPDVDDQPANQEESPQQDTAGTRPTKEPQQASKKRGVAEGLGHGRIILDSQTGLLYTQFTKG